MPASCFFIVETVHRLYNVYSFTNRSEALPQRNR